MMNEIGSEFWNTEPICSDTKYLLSGRTALDFIIKDILSTKKIESVMLPSYCCHTMITPFEENKIKVRFYDVYFDDDRGLCADIPEAEENEIFYHMTYFGFSALHGIDIKKIKNAYSVIIDDRTHSWLSSKGKAECDYYYESYRKWAGFYGIAKAVKTTGAFSDQALKTNEKYVSLRKQAFDLKNQYIASGIGDKNKFLEIFGEAESLLEVDYCGYSAPDICYRQLLTFNKKACENARQKNAKILIDGLKNINQIKLMFSELSPDDTPLFIPVIISRGRDALRKHLIQNKIYCPTHWPLCENHSGISERTGKLYKTELSIPCDQRYNQDDMLRVVSVIKEFYEGDNSL